MIAPARRRGRPDRWTPTPLHRVACPTCGAPAGERCRTTRAAYGRPLEPKPISMIHRARIDAAFAGDAR